MDTGDKASNKAMAVAHKYALLQTFCIPTKESQTNDVDQTTPPDTLPKIKDLPTYNGSNAPLPPQPPPGKVPADKPPKKTTLPAEDSFNYLSHFVADIGAATTRDQMMKIYHKYFTEAKAVMTDTDTTQAKKAYKQKFDTFQKEPKKGEKDAKPA
jgi:hypothetical protein